MEQVIPTPPQKGLASDDASGQLRATYGIKALDSFIAAALMTGTNLATRNVRDFHRIPNLDIREL
jgi:predicted nucleic acid-binding protein